MSDLRVVNAHVHFWDPDRFHYVWLDADPRLRGSFGPEDVPTGSVPVESFIFVEADRRSSESLAEVEWALALPTPSQPIAAVVAAAALELPAADTELDKLQQHSKVKGVRRLLQDAPPGFTTGRRFVSGVRSLADRGLVFDLCVRRHPLAEARGLAQRCPEVTFVLDHLGKPRMGQVPERSWLLDLQRLAALPNTRCKLSGLATEVLDPIGAPHRSELFRPYLDHALQTFGPSRCMFGSDWPVASLALTYEEWFDQVTAALNEFSIAETHQVLRLAAVHTYRLTP